MDQRDHDAVMNSKRGAIGFEVEGVQRALRFTTNAMVKYQDEAGETLLAGLQELQDNPGDMRRVRLIFWCGLDGSPTLEDAGDVMDELGFAEALTIIGRAAEAAFPPAPEGEAPKGNPEKGRRKPAA